MGKVIFDNDLYLQIQREKILERIASFDDKLYLEFGGKLFDDMHASRILPGFKPDSKLQMLLGIKEKVEIIIVVNANDIKNRKVRNDSGLTYDVEVERLIVSFKSLGLYVSGVVLSFYEDNENIKVFIKHLKNLKVPAYKHYQIAGYPEDIPLIVSEQGLGKNEYIKTSRPLVVVTAPGPGSGKMATCLSQLYHDMKNNIRAGYAKFETFPVWNLPLHHPVNIAYEAATVDLNDVNMIDPYHLEKYGVTATNYNRDIEVFPLLEAIFEKIYGESPYFSPTDMGVNMVGFAIKDDKAVQEACRQEVIRRYYQAMKNNLLGSYTDEDVQKERMLMKQLNVTVQDRKCVEVALQKYESANSPAVAIELKDGTIVSGKRSELLSAPSAAILNALKYLGHIEKNIPLLSRNVIEPIQSLKIGPLGNANAKIRVEEILIALAIQASTNPLAEMALSKLDELKDCEAHSSSLLSSTEIKTLVKLGLRVTEEPTNFISKQIKK